MKFSDVLLEAADPKLLKYLSGNSDYYKVGPDYVFIWTNNRLRELLKNGARMGDAGLGTVTTPVKTSDGLGVVSVRTGDVCVGAVDRDYVARWISSVPDGDPARFFKTIQSHKIRELPTKLQDLGDYYSSESEKGDSTKVTSKGVQKIIDTINTNDDYENLRDESEILDIEDMSPSEAKSHFEEMIRKMKHREKILEKQVKKINDIIHAKMDSLSDEELDRLLDQKKKMGGSELRYISWVMNELERFIKREANLFIDDAKEKADDEEEINDTDTDNKIDLWIEEFETNFPGLEIRDAFQFDPNI
jgi:hypothetical protein